MSGPDLAAVRGDDIPSTSSKRWEALMSQGDGIWFSNNQTGEVKFRRSRR